MGNVLKNSVKYEKQTIGDLQLKLKSLKSNEKANEKEITKIEKKINKHQQVLNYLLSH